MRLLLASVLLVASPAVSWAAKEDDDAKRKRYEKSANRQRAEDISYLERQVGQSLF